MSLSALNDSVREHEELLAKNKVKMGILVAYIRSKLEDIGEGSLFIGNYFPDEVMFTDLEKLSDTQVAEIHAVGERYYLEILQKGGIKL